MLTCRAYDESQRSAWDNFVDACRTPLFFFKRNYLDYHADRFMDSSFIFSKEEAIVAIFPASHHGDTLSSHGGLTYGGLLLSDKARSSDVLEISALLAEQARALGFKKIIYKAIPYLFYARGAQEDLYAIFNLLNAKIFRRDLSSVIYLNNRMKLSRGRKERISRANKLGLSIEDSSDWFSFHELLTLVLQRHGVSPVHSVTELEYLSSQFPTHIQLKTIKKENQLLAGTLLFKFHNTVHAQYLATSEEGKKVGALDVLIEACIEESKQLGYQYFSLGASTLEQGKKLNEGLIAQKETFGARGMVLDFYMIELNQPGCDESLKI